MASGETIIPRDTQNQADSQRNGVQTDALHKDMTGLDISTNGSKTSMGTTVESKATSVTEADIENDGPALALDMQNRCRFLLDELEQFEGYLKEQGKDKTTELRPFKTEVQAEIRSIDKVVHETFRGSQQLLIFLHS